MADPLAAPADTLNLSKDWVEVFAKLLPKALSLANSMLVCSSSALKEAICCSLVA